MWRMQSRTAQVCVEGRWSVQVLAGLRDAASAVGTTHRPPCTLPPANKPALRACCGRYGLNRAQGKRNKAVHVGTHALAVA